MSIVPTSRPRQSRVDTEKIAAVHGVTDAVILIGIRGYYQDTMGKPGVNDRGIYDDAIILISPSAYVTFNANVDPSIYRPRIATLVPGVYRYKLGIHGLSKPRARQYRALVQAAKVTVRRDRAGTSAGLTDTGFFGINIHRGGAASTSSLGCQTIHPAQWPAFIATVQQELARYAQTTVPYILIEHVQ